MEKETAFSIRLFQTGVKLVLKKTQVLGSDAAFIRAHTKSIGESVTSGMRVVKPRDILLLQMVKLMARGGVRKPVEGERSMFFYTPFLSKLPRIAKVSYLVHRNDMGQSVLYMRGSDILDINENQYSANDMYPVTVEKSVEKYSRIIKY